MKLLIINGPNLNFIGIREPQIYGNQSYQELCEYITKEANRLQIETEIVQTNYEGKILDFIQNAYYEKIDGIIINPGAYTHYSYAIRDALQSVSIPTVEVHLSNIYEREAFRKKSVISDVCLTSFVGYGFESYLKALNFLNERRQHD